MSPPPINLTSKSNSKQKQVVHHEIIDLEDQRYDVIDLDEDDVATVHINGNVGGSSNGKEVIPNLKVSNLANGEFEIDVQLLENGTADGEDDWINSYYDDITFDDHTDIQPHFDHMDIPPGVEASFPWLEKTSTSTMTSSSSKVGRPKRKQASDWLDYGTTSQLSGGPNPGNEPSPHSVKRRSFRSLSATHLSIANNISSSYTDLSIPSTSASGTTPATVEQRNEDVILQNFKRFDTVEDFSDHHYSKNGSSAKQPPKNWAKRIQEEWKILEKDLPDKIFVRVYESRMDLLRAVIIGAEGTPYHDGLFFFDVYFPSTYPNVPPHVHYHSGGLRINPNLYNCGKVCLSLLNTWSGGQKEKWIPRESTMLQVLVSIQGLILNVKPYFNEPGYAHSHGSKSGEENSLKYNESTFMLSLQTMVYNMRRPPKCFEEFVVGHFCKHAREILVSCKAYLDGAQVGCLVKGGVQDVDEGDKSCSKGFRTNLAGFITTLVNAFSQIGAKDCQEFLSLAQKPTKMDPKPKKMEFLTIAPKPKKMEFLTINPKAAKKSARHRSS